MLIFLAPRSPRKTVIFLVPFHLALNNETISLCAVIAFCGALADAIKDVRAKRFIAETAARRGKNDARQLSIARAVMSATL